MKLSRILVLGWVCICMMGGSAWAGWNTMESQKSSGKKAHSEKQKEHSPVKAAENPAPKPEPVKPKIEPAKSDKQVESQTAPAIPGEIATSPEGVSKPDEPAAEGSGEPPATAPPPQTEPETPAGPEVEPAEEKPVKPPIEISSQAGALTFNFDDAELAEVIRTMADLLQINYLIDPKVAGKVTIHTAGELNRKDLIPIFYQILEINGLTAVKQGNLYKIIPAKDASRLSIASQSGKEGKNASAGEEIIIQIIPLNSISADEMSKILAPFTSADGVIVAQAETNTVLVIDRSYNIEKILRLVNTFDSNVFDRVKYRFYPIKNGDAASLADVVTKMMESYGSAFKTSVSLIPIDRLNALLVISSNPKIFEELDEFIKNYDIPSQSMEPTIFVYPVKNGQAGDIASLLNSVFRGKTEKKEEKTTKPRNPLLSKSSKGSGKDKNTSQKDLFQKEKSSYPTASESTQSPSLTEAATGESEVSVGKNSLHGEVSFTVDDHRNSVIIQASPADFQIIKNLLSQIDVMPRQVLIEVTIAEITLDESTQLGVEWTYKKGPGSMSTSLLDASLGSKGLQFSIGNPDRWKAAISALASQNKVNILSSPTILASNSVPATIEISTEVPVATSSYQYTTVENPVLSTDIEYRDTGVLLTVTPQINELGLVTMEIQQEVSDQAGDKIVGGNTYPSFFKRSAETTLTVQSGQTIAIGGLIKQTKSNSVSGTPWISTIPVLNFIFGNTKDTSTKTELIIMLSPYVIAEMDDVDAITKEFKQKVSTLFPDMSKESPVTKLDEKKQ